MLGFQANPAKVFCLAFALWGRGRGDRGTPLRAWRHIDGVSVRISREECAVGGVEKKIASLARRVGLGFKGVQGCCGWGEGRKGQRGKALVFNAALVACVAGI